MHEDLGRSEEVSHERWGKEGKEKGRRETFHDLHKHVGPFQREGTSFINDGREFLRRYV